MEEEEVRIVAQQAASLADGRHTIVVNERRIPIRIASLDDEEITRTTLAQSLYRRPKSDSKLIDHVELMRSEESVTTNSLDFAQLLKRIAELFSISWIEIKTETTELLIDYRKYELLDHFTPIIGFLQVDPFIRLLYHDYGQRESLNTYILHAFQNIQTSSKRFNLLLYQLFECYNAFIHRNIYPIFSTNFIEADTNLWLTISLDSILQQRCFFPTEQAHAFDRHSTPTKNNTRLWEQSEAWRRGEISNFDYLMLLNEYAGRVRNDPNKHPILPWVVDFTSKNGGYRDLTKTKYRIAKGDAQLNETYKRQQLAHHIPELLSDICYMVYRARIESKEVLCRHVRSQWVPEEYPSTMCRLYSWTPDECIPEFFEDPKIFKSMHDDLPDLQLPEWIQTADEFISWHREKLESPEVSAQLHHWIDLIFGYKLSGEAAVEALNVHLCFVRRSPEFRTAGAVQLFTRPHPNRSITTDNTNRNDENNRFYPVYAEENLPPNVPLTPVADGEPFDLMALLQRIYAKHNHVDDYVEKSAMSIGVTIVELALPEYCRDLSPLASFEDRLKRAQSLTGSYLCKLPRHIRKALCLLLKVQIDDVDGKCYRFSTSMLNFFSLPYSVVPAHRLLATYHAKDYLLHNALVNDENQRAREYFLEKIDIVWNGVEFVDFNPIWRDLFIEMMQELKFAVLVCDRLFGRIMEFMDGDDEDSVLRLATIRLLEYNIPDLAVLFDRRFLLQLCIRFGSQSFLMTFLPLVVEAVLSQSTVLHDVARESILWLTKRYGPIITVNIITPNILRLMALCYVEPDQLKPDFEEISLDVHVAGDSACDLVIEVLTNISFIYGPAFITLHYFAYSADVIDQAHRRLTPGLESAAIGTMSWIQECLNCLSDRQLMDNLKEIVDKILFPAVRLMCSTNVQFSSDRIRRLFVCKTIRFIHLLGCRLGPDNVQRHLSAVILRIFCTFNVLYDLEETTNGQTGKVKLAENPPKQLVTTFTPAFAKLLLHNFSCICTRQYILNALPNTTLIAQIAANEKTTPIPSASIPIAGRGEVNKSSSDVLSSIIGSNVDAVLSVSPSSISSFVAPIGGNRLSTFQVGSEPASLIDSPTQEHLASGFDPNSNLTLNRKMSEDSVMHLANSWVDRFRAVLSATSDSFGFDQISLVNYTGHTGAIRRICALDNENSFITGSSDKTVRLWSIKTTEETSNCQWTYKGHSKPISDLVYLPAISIIASADTQIHIWDPFRGSAIHQLEWPVPVGNDHTIVAVNRINHRLLALGANSENVIRTLDVRTGWWAHHFCVSNANPSPSNGVRAMSVSPSSKKIVVALNNGSTALIDTRIGKVLGVSIIQHVDASQLVWLDDDHFVSVHTDHAASVWQTNPRLKMDRKLTETANLVARCTNDQFLTLQSSNKLRFYRNGDCHNEIRLRSEFIPGSITAIEALPLNRMLLIGASSGALRLAC
ncbi:putative WD repeat-containing protein F52C9.1 [Aphelenchoides besseyi]|nr:putative WD repeat-containing protein F52C9.1 [Aphelenchoides besseyi]